MASSPIKANSDLVTFSVSSNGSPIKDTYQVLSVVVDMSVNKVPHCILEIADGSPASADFPISDSSTFVPGAKIEVKAGYESSNQTIFSGMVIKHGIRIGEEGPVLTLLCKDECVKMMVGRKSAYFKDTTDSSIIAKLIEDHGLSAAVSATSVQLKEVIQYYATDWDFMVSRADVNGMIVMAKSGQVSVKRPEEETDEVLSLTYGLDILEFDAELDAQDQYKTIQASAWDIKKQEVSSGNASLSNFPIGNLNSDQLADVIGLEEYQLQSSGFLESSTLSSWAKAQATKSTYAKVRGTVKFQGSALALPGKLIQLNGVGKRFSGKGLVSGVRHEIREGDWVTTARLGLSSKWFTEAVKTEAPLAAGLLPGMQGLQIGKVMKIDSDPDGEFRVLVKLPLIQSGDDGVWARLSTFYATNNAGAFFYPEVDDEVVIGFFNDDPRYPVILGSMYSSGRAAPDTPDETNKIKAIVSREQMKITFDEEKKIISIITPNRNQLVFSDEDQSITMADQHNNSIKLSSSGIEINSASDIQIKAAQSIGLEGPEGISVSASGGSISLSGMNISCSADTEFSASAGASASFSSSGELSIDGTMVLINS